MQWWEQTDPDAIRAYAGDINSEWRKKTKSWRVHTVAVSARRTYITAVSTRTIHAQSMYCTNLETEFRGAHSNTANTQNIFLFKYSITT